MAPVFIFSKDIQKALDTDKKEVVVPRGARISAAALDLIKDNGVNIRFVSDQADDAVEVPAGPLEAAPPVPAISPISDEELERVVSRVIERFKERKGKPPLETTESESRPADDDLVICRCEEITRGEIKDVIKNGMKTLNGIKRITRAGMGLCQGQTCQRLVNQILATELDISPMEIKPTTARAPVRPILLSAFSTG